MDIAFIAHYCRHGYSPLSSYDIPPHTLLPTCNTGVDRTVVVTYAVGSGGGVALTAADCNLVVSWGGAGRTLTLTPLWKDIMHTLRKNEMSSVAICIQNGTFPIGVM